MITQLSDIEVRVIGTMLEKQKTTPEQYPLSLNALCNACNQKSNRDPIMSLDEVTVQATLDDLIKKHLVAKKTGFGSRVEKYAQRFCRTEFSRLQISEQEAAILCILFLRGPQTPGEIRTRSHRLCAFTDIDEVESALTDLCERSDGPLVVKLAREPGRRESRFAHLFTDPPATGFDTAGADRPAPPMAEDGGEVALLRDEVQCLREELAQLRDRLDEIAS